jgi:hypothetical protein
MQKLDLFFNSTTTRTGPGQPTYRSFTITLRHTTLDRTPVPEGSAIAKISDNTQHSQETDIHAPAGFEPSIPAKRAATDRRLRRRGQWDLQELDYCTVHEHLLRKVFQQKYTAQCKSSELVGDISEV